jgi:hypothetical protein
VRCFASASSACMARDCEACGCCYGDLTGTTLTVYGKQHKTRTVDISPRLADAINACRKRSNSELLFPNGNPLVRLCTYRTNGYEDRTVSSRCLPSISMNE